MPGEIIKSCGVCLAIHPWSRTSHVVKWLTPSGCVTTAVKGAERPKSQFLGQYDLNYTCEILYYARAHGEVHALRECAASNRRDKLRSNFRSMMLATWFRHLTGELTPNGPEASRWKNLLERSLDGIEEKCDVQELLKFELEVLRLEGIFPEFSRENGVFYLRGERKIPISEETMSCIANPSGEKKMKILLDAARVISVFYSIHLNCASEVRRMVMQMIL